MGIGLFALLKFVDALAEVAATFGINGYLSSDIDYLNAIIWAIVAGFCLIIAVIAAIAEVQKCAETKLTISVKEILIVGVAITLVYLLRIWIVNARDKELELILEALSFIAIGGSLMVVFLIWIKKSLLDLAQIVSEARTKEKSNAHTHIESTPHEGRRRWKFKGTSEGQEDEVKQ